MFCFPWLKHNFPISLLNPFLSYLNRKAFARQPPLSLREASFVVLFRRLWSFPSSSFRLGYVCVCVCVCVCVNLLLVSLPHCTVCSMWQGEGCHLSCLALKSLHPGQGLVPGCCSESGVN